MPIFIFSPNKPLKFLSDANHTLDNTYANKYCYMNNTADRTVSVDLDLITLANFEVIIRNDQNSLGTITLLATNVQFNVSGDLGLVIPAGGIGELRRRGTQTTVDFYGYIQG